MPRTSENGVFMSCPGPGMRPSAASTRSSPSHSIASAASPFSVEQRLPGVDAQQERGPERQHDEHQQRRLERAARARHEVRERVADREAQDRRHRRVDEARREGAQVQVVLREQEVVAEADAERDRAVLPGDDVLDRRRLHLGDADPRDDEEGQQEEREQPRVGHGDDREAAAAERAVLIGSARPATGRSSSPSAGSPQVSGAPGWRSTLLWLILSTRPLAICR